MAKANSETLYRRFGQEFNPFLGMKRLNPSKSDDAIGRSRTFILDEMVSGEVILENYISGGSLVGTDYLVKISDGRTTIRPLSQALGGVSIGLNRLVEDSPAIITCTIRVRSIRMRAVDQWYLNQTDDAKDAALFYNFFVPGKNDLHGELVMDTDLTGPHPELYVPRFRFDIQQEGLA